MLFCRNQFLAENHGPQSGVLIKFGLYITDTSGVLKFIGSRCTASLTAYLNASLLTVAVLELHVWHLVQIALAVATKFVQNNFGLLTYTYNYVPV